MPRRDTSVIVRAPASTANLGPGFDCAAAALDLWNELHLEEGEHAVVVEGEGAAEVPTDAEHLALRAFALVAATAKPGGAAATKSPWLAHTRISGGTPVKSAAEALSPVTRTVA